MLKNNVKKKSMVVVATVLMTSSISQNIVNVSAISSDDNILIDSKSSTKVGVVTSNLNVRSGA